MSYDFTFSSQKYKLNDLLKEIFYVLKTGIPWRSLRSKINWNTVYKHYVKLNKYKIFEKSYAYLLNKYLIKNRNKLKYVFTDTTIISNKYGENKANLNKYYKNKKVTKLSLISIKDGIPFNIKLYGGNVNDGKIFLDQSSKCELFKNNRYKKYFMTDKGYDSKHIKELCKNLGYEVVIPQNRRGIKDTNKIIKFKNEQKILYRKRIKIENMFNKLKCFRRLSIRYDRKESILMGFIHLALLFIIKSQ